MPIAVRPMRAGEARAFLEIQRASVRSLAARDYPATVIAEWAPLPVTDADLALFLQNPDDEIRLVAEMDGEVVGIGALVASGSELRACYVMPGAARKGVGSALVQEIERLARERGLRELRLVSSITAEPFYRHLGYQVEHRGNHVLRSGTPMAAVRMLKVFKREEP